MMFFVHLCEHVIAFSTTNQDALKLFPLKQVFFPCLTQKELLNQFFYHFYDKNV